MRLSGWRVARLGAGMAAAVCVALLPSAAGTSARQSGETPARPNLLALDLGARVERATSRYDFPYGPYKLLDDDPATVWASSSPVFPQELVFAFAGRDTVLVAGLSITFPKPGTDPGWGGPNDGKVWARDVEVWTSNESPAAGFTKATAASLPMATGTHAVTLASPIRAKFIKLVDPVESWLHPLRRDCRRGGPGRRRSRLPAAPAAPRGSCGGVGGPRNGSAGARCASERDRPRIVRGGRGHGTVPQARKPERAGRRQGSRGLRPLPIREAVARVAEVALLHERLRLRPPRLGDLLAPDVLVCPAGCGEAVGAGAVGRRRHGRALANLRRENEPQRAVQAGAGRLGRARPQARHPGLGRLRPRQRARLLVPAAPAQNRERRRAGRAGRAALHREQRARERRSRQPVLGRHAVVAGKGQRKPRQRPRRLEPHHGLRRRVVWGDDRDRTRPAREASCWPTRATAAARSSTTASTSTSSPTSRTASTSRASSRCRSIPIR